MAVLRTADQHFLPAAVPAVPPQIETWGPDLWECEGIMAFFLTIVHAQESYSTLLVWWWVKPDEKTGGNASSSVWFVIDIKGNIFSLEHLNQLTANIWTRGEFIYQVLYSLRAHTSCWEHLLPSSSATTKNKTNKKKNTRIQEDFSWPCIVIVSVWTLGHFPHYFSYKTN